MIRFQFLLILAFCAIGLFGPSLIQCAPIEASGTSIYDVPTEQLSPFEWSDEVSKHTRRSIVSVRSGELERRGWLSAFNQITTTAKQIGNAVISGATQVKNAVEVGKELLADFTGLASDARSATTAVKNMAQEAITNISKLPTNLIVGLKDETRQQLEKTLGSLTQEVSSKLPTIGGLDTVVSNVLIHLSATALNKLEDVADEQIAKLNATRSHIAENINGLFEAPANAINSFLKDVVEEDLQNLTDMADDYITNVDDFCDTLGKYVDGVQNIQDAANYDWTDINSAAKNINSLVVSFTDAQDNVAAVEVRSGLPEGSRITVHVFEKLSSQRLHWLKVYMSLQVNLSKREEETAITKNVIERILGQQGEDTNEGGEDEGVDDEGDEGGDDESDDSDDDC